tara:strand:+ start:561 stop:1388 length:828 start_codon:yes stop_codon:yes gene_type:complete
MKAKKKPAGKEVKNKGKTGATYDFRGGRYPTGVNPKTTLQRKEYFSADEAPEEASGLNIDSRITDAIFEVSDTMGASQLRTDSRINKYGAKARNYVGDRIAKRMNAKARMRLSEGETEYIPKVNKVIDKLSTLSDKEINSLKGEVIRLSKEYKNIDSEASNADKMSAAAKIAANQDWSSIKPIREKAGLTKSDLISLIQAPTDAGVFEKLGFGAARVALGLKDFRTGGKVPVMIKRKDGSSSPRGLWDNIRAKKGSGKKPTKEILKAAKKIKDKG